MCGTLGRQGQIFTVKVRFLICGSVGNHSGIYFWASLATVVPRPLLPPGPQCPRTLLEEHLLTGLGLVLAFSPPRVPCGQGSVCSLQPSSMARLLQLLGHEGPTPVPPRLHRNHVVFRDTRPASVTANPGHFLRPNVSMLSVPGFPTLTLLPAQ